MWITHKFTPNIEGGERINLHVSNIYIQIQSMFNNTTVWSEGQSAPATDSITREILYKFAKFSLNCPSVVSVKFSDKISCREPNYNVDGNTTHCFEAYSKNMWTIIISNCQDYVFQYFQYFTIVVFFILFLAIWKKGLNNLQYLCKNIKFAIMK